MNNFLETAKAFVLVGAVVAIGLGTVIGGVIALASMEFYMALATAACCAGAIFPASIVGVGLYQWYDNRCGSLDDSPASRRKAYAMGTALTIATMGVFIGGGQAMRQIPFVDRNLTPTKTAKAPTSAIIGKTIIERGER
jgi:hypothetical protein